MNSIQLKNRIDFYNNVSQSARWYNYEYDNAVNDVIEKFKGNMLGDPANRNPENFQWVQQIRDNLYTLIKTATPVITPGSAVTNQYFSALPSTIPFPADYSDFVLLMCTIDSYTIYARPTTFNQIGPLLQDTFRHPTNEKPYFNDSTAGLTIWRDNSGAMSSVTLTYIKLPATFTIGLESQLINPGGAVLTNGLSYIATQQSVQNAVTYAIGTQFTAVGTSLTSGQVILASNTVPVDLPVKTHEEIAKAASSVMLGTISGFENSAFSEKEAKEG